MTPSRNAPRSYFSAPPPGQVRPASEPPALSPRMRSVALACTAVAMLGTVAVLGSVAVMANLSEKEAAEAAVIGAADAIRASVAPEVRKDVLELREAAAIPGAAAQTPQQDDAGLMAAGAEDEVIPADDARWARNMPSGPMPRLEATMPELASAYGKASRETRPALSRAWAVIDDEEPVRRARSEPRGTRKPAETGEIQTVEKLVDRVMAPKAAAGQGVINTGANIRAAARNGSRVLGAIPAGTTVRVMSCDIWCEVEHDGRRGYVIAKFISRGAAAPAARTEKPAEARTAKAQQPAERQHGVPTGQTGGL